MSRSAQLLPLLAVLIAPTCAGSRVPTRSGVATPYGPDFFEYPEKYRGRTVRLVNLTVARVDITRPLVLIAEQAERVELLVSDGRSLASRQGVKPGDRVAVQIECTEGRRERGNLLLSIDSWPAR